MTRLVINVSGEQHQQIKALAALQGKTLEDYMLEKALPDYQTDDNAMEEFKSLVADRIASAEAEQEDGRKSKTFDQIFQEVLDKRAENDRKA